MEEPTKVVKASDLVFPPVTMGRSKKVAPSFTDEELWHFVGERGVYSACPRNFKYAFDVLVHREGVLFYRMKPRDEWFITIDDPVVDKDNMFPGIVIHDPMEHFITRENHTYDAEKDYLCILHTHGKNGKPHDELETWCSVPMDEFARYLDPTLTPLMDGFSAAVEAYNRRKRGEDQESPTKKHRSAA